MAIKAILFDLDGTLLDTMHCMQAALAGTCTLAMECCPELTEERLREAYYGVIRDVDRQLGVGELSFGTAYELDLHLWREIGARCGIAPAHAAALADRYRERRRENHRLYPDVPEHLPDLSQRYRAFVLTNGPGELQREKIAVVGLERWTEGAFVSGELGVWKPQPEIFQHALAELGCAPAEAVMVGDSLSHDIAGAAAVGLRTIWMNRYGWSPQPDIAPDATIEDLRPLVGVLGGW